MTGTATLVAGEGNDILKGGAGNDDADVFVFETGDRTGLIADLDQDVDTIDLTVPGLAFADLTITGAMNALIDTGTDLTTVNGVTAAELNSDQFEFGV